MYKPAKKLRSALLLAFLIGFPFACLVPTIFWIGGMSFSERTGVQAICAVMSLIVWFISSRVVMGIQSENYRLED